MLRFFRINDPYRLVFIFLGLVVVRTTQHFIFQDTTYYELKWLLLGEWLGSGFEMYSETYDYTGPLSALIYNCMHVVAGRNLFLHYGLSSVLIVVQAAVFNRLLLKNKAYDENGYVPAFLYTVLAAIIPDFMLLSPQLIAATFILLTLRNVLRRLDNQATDILFLNAGVLLGIATLFYLPAILFLIVFLLAFVFFSSAVLRRLLIYLFGWSLVMLLCGCYFYLTDRLAPFIYSFIIAPFAIPKNFVIAWSEWGILTAPFVILGLFSLVRMSQRGRLTNFQQKVHYVFWLILFAGIGCFFLSIENAGHELIFIVPFLAYVWTHYFFLLRKRFFRYIMPPLMILGVICYGTYATGRFSDPFVQTETIAPPAKTLYLGESLIQYADIPIYSPCFNAYLTQKAIAGLDHYRDTERMYLLLLKLNPSFIVDNIGAMSSLRNRFPLIMSQYRRTGGTTYQKINN